MSAALKAFCIEASPAAMWMGRTDHLTSGEAIPVRSPIDGATLATIRSATTCNVERVIESAADAFVKWRDVPAPRRGEFVRRLGEQLRRRKNELAEIVQLEVGKITQEALGEVQEMIDICDFRAAGSSHDGAVASARPRWRDHGFQLSGRRLGLERRDRAGLRRSGGMETQRKDAAHGDRVYEDRH